MNCHTYLSAFFVGESGKSAGSELGLYIVKSIVEEAGGTVSTTCEDGMGATFDFIILIR